jgi:hypothetical protein
MITSDVVYSYGILNTYSELISLLRANEETLI